MSDEKNESSDKPESNKPNETNNSENLHVFKDETLYINSQTEDHNVDGILLDFAIKLHTFPEVAPGITEIKFRYSVELDSLDVGLLCDLINVLPNLIRLRLPPVHRLTGEFKPVYQTELYIGATNIDLINGLLNSARNIEDLEVNAYSSRDEDGYLDFQDDWNFIRVVTLPSLQTLSLGGNLTWLDTFDIKAPKLKSMMVENNCFKTVSLPFLATETVQDLYIGSEEGVLDSDTIRNFLSNAREIKVLTFNGVEADEPIDTTDLFFPKLTHLEFDFFEPTHTLSYYMSEEKEKPYYGAVISLLPCMADNINFPS
jgi:hypothetical protein